ncbi:MAG: class I SAM-dependent methyltransferase [Thermoanaerobaculum sp.]|nr:class I SAM-dependent methyltransferase [Thermoanaerobaculum sp.]MDW7968741.1 class I SAM-dependent methyltransferase [Thermoanaerobaculum sp.]
MESFLRYRDAHHPQWVVAAYALAPPAFQKLLAEELAWLQRLVQPPLVEVGCGAGRILAALGVQGGSVVGLDLVPRYLVAARRLNVPAWWVAGDGLRPPLRRNHWRTVIFGQATLGSLGSEPLRRRMLTSLAELVAPGGRLLVTAYGPQARQARREWYEAQQRAGLLPPFDPARTREGTFAFTNGFVSQELTAHELQAHCPQGLVGAVTELPSGLLAASWRRV